MIRIDHVSKQFDNITAVNDLSLSIEKGKVFGLLGTNGAGKSTLMRIICGIIRPDQGEVLSDDRVIYENPEVKQEIFYISDDAYYFANCSAMDMIRFYQLHYPNFQAKRIEELLDKFSLDKNRRISTFSKGMKKQLSLLLGICSGTKWLFCDESFDGLDPVMRQAVKTLFAQEMCDRDFTPVIASHNLRELEDICDHVGLLHQGGILLSRDLEDLKGDLHKVQLAIEDTSMEDYLRQRLDILHIEKRGSLYTVTARGDLDIILTVIRAKEPVFCESLSLSLEEIFISETGVHGYDIKNLIL
jgi:ABC-2 type transport system ATP-binding protein